MYGATKVLKEEPLHRLSPKWPGSERLDIVAGIVMWRPRDDAGSRNAIREDKFA
jgi:hypothetical protein